MKYSIESPNVKPEGKRLINTIELIRKQAKYRVELADIGIAIADSRIEGDKSVVKDLQADAASIRRRIAVIGVRLTERITSVS